MSTYTTSRNSSQTAFKWKHELPLNEIEKVQEICSEAMARFGYNLINSQEDIDNENFKRDIKKRFKKHQFTFANCFHPHACSLYLCERKLLLSSDDFLNKQIQRNACECAKFQKTKVKEQT